MTTDRPSLLPLAERQALAAFCDAVAAAFGEAFVGVFLEGSFAWGDPVATSDLDLRVVSRVTPTETQATTLAESRAVSEAMLGRQVGARVDVLADLLRVGTVRFQHAMPLAGDDIRAQVPLKPLAAFARDSMFAAHDLVIGRRVEPAATVPPFFGYDTQAILDHGAWILSSKRLVNVVTAIATAFVARTGAYVSNKGEAAAKYAERVGGAWAPFVTAVHDECRLRYSYRLPADPHERRRLADRCQRALRFEDTLLAASIPTFHDLATGSDERLAAAARGRLDALSAASTIPR